MLVLGLIVFVFVMIMFPTIRCAVGNLGSVIVYSIKDFYNYVIHYKRNLCPSGKLVAYCGLFGKGKTLSAVHEVVDLYRIYNGRKIWCPRRKKFVTQRIHVISNVSLSVPYEDFVSLEQLVLAAERSRPYDDEHDTLTITLALGDEFSVQMNSRAFKNNIDPMLLNTILTCRHYYMSLYYTAQRFGHVDALLRQVTSVVYQCDKLWRFQRLNAYDAWDLENAQSPTLVAPIARTCWFVRDRDYNAYDTLACVGNLKKSMQRGEMMSEAEILALQQNVQDTNMDAVLRPSRSWLRTQRRRSK